MFVNIGVDLNRLHPRDLSFREPEILGGTMKHALLICLVAFAALAWAEAPAWDWARTPDGTRAERGETIALDSSGNVYVAGWFMESVVFGSTTLTAHGSNYWDIFVAKADPAGNWLWAASAGGYDSDCAQGLAVDSAGNCFLTGYFAGSASFGATTLNTAGDSDIFVAKLDPLGNWLWASRAGGGDFDRGYDLVVGSGGLIYVTGSFENAASFGAASLSGYGSQDIFLAVLGAAGAWIGAIKAGGPGADVGYGIARDSSGNTYVTGLFSGSATFYTSTLDSHGSTDIFLAKFDPSGLFVGVAGAGGGGMDSGNDVVTDSAGNVYMTGSYSNTAYFGPFTLTSEGYDDVFVAKVLPSGFLEGVVSGGGDGMDMGFGIAVDPAGDIYVTGFIYGSAAFGATVLPWHDGDNIFAAKLNPTGTWLWAQWAGGNYSDWGCDIAADNAGNSYVTGDFVNSASFGPFPFQLTDALSTMFLAKIKHDPYIPLAPQNLAITSSDFICALTWDPVTEDANGHPVTPTHYQVYRSTLPGGPFTPVLPLATGCWWYGSADQSTLFFKVTAVLEN